MNSMCFSTMPVHCALRKNPTMPICAGSFMIFVCRERLENDNTFDWCLPRPSLDVDSHQIPGSNTRIDRKTISKDNDTSANSSKRVVVHCLNLKHICFANHDPDRLRSHAHGQ